MSPRTSMQHMFTDIIPDTLEDGVVYISIPYATALHLCCCGCQSEVVTPLSPVDWSLTFDGQSISLSPSIGNWSFPCQSHYWIKRDKIRWDRRWSRTEIEASRSANASEYPGAPLDGRKIPRSRTSDRWWARIMLWKRHRG
jgi:hypothetical protein